LNTAIQKSKAPHSQPNSNAVQNVLNKSMTTDVEKPQYLSFTDFIKKRKIQVAKIFGKRRNRLIENEMYNKEALFHYEEEEHDVNDYPIKI